jgi:SAM-dependent methyltransferase
MSADPPNTVYTHGHGASVLASHRWRTVENSAGYLLEHLRPTDHVLDVGCGPGTITHGLAARVPQGRVVGLDSSADVIASAVADRAASAAHLTFEVGDVYALDHPDHSFHVVHAHQVLQHVDDPVRALTEMRRVCRPGGIVAARDADYAAMTWAPADPRLDRWLELYRAVAQRNGGEPDAGRRLLGWAHAAGFDEVIASADVWCFTTEEDRAWWSSTWADRVSRSRLAEQVIELGLAGQAELDDLAAGWTDWGASADGWFAVLHGAVVCRRP